MKSRDLICRSSLVIALLTSSACDGPRGVDQQIVSAKESISKSNYAEATISLKNALRDDAANAEVRFLLGSALLMSEKFVEAEIELKKAQELGYDQNKVVPLIARALLALQRDKTLTETFGEKSLPDKSADIDLQTTLAVAYARQDDRAKARKLIDSILIAQPDFSRALILRARMLAGERDFAGGLRIADELLKREPVNIEALALRADLYLFGLMDLPAAIKDFNAILKVQPPHMAAHSALVAIHVFKKDLVAAKSQLGQMRAVYPEAAQTRFVEAQIAVLEGKYTVAKEITSGLLKFSQDNAKLLQLAGAVELKLNAVNQAEAYLAKALSVDPSQPVTRRLLARALNRKGQSERAITVLRPLIDSDTPDAEALTLAAEAYLIAGDAARSERFFVQVARLKPDDSAARTAVAVAKISRGATQAGFNDLESISRVDKGALADLVIIDARMRRGELQAALQAIDAMSMKEPESPLADNLRGRVLVRLKDYGGAQKSFERALVKDGGFFPAVDSLAALDLHLGRPQVAKSRLLDFLARNPTSVPARIVLVDISIKLKAPRAEITGLIDDAIKQDPVDPVARLARVAYLRSLRDNRGALTAAQEAANLLPGNAQVQEALGVAQMATDELNQAMATFSKLAADNPRAVGPHLRMADVYMLRRNPDAARKALKRALEIDPSLVDAQFGLITMALREKDTAQAKEIARTVQRQRPDNVLGYMFEGDIEAGAGNILGAVSAYKKGLSLRDPGQLPIKIQNLLVKSGRTAEAERFAGDWLKANPKDISFAFHLADQALLLGQKPAAERAYRRVLEIDPANPLAMNNLAWVLLESRNAEAIELAAKAVEIVPGSSAFLDTYARTLARGDRLSDAISAARKAARLGAASPVYQLNLVELLLQAGSKAEARAELSAINIGKDSGTLKAQVEDLIKRAKD